MPYKYTNDTRNMLEGYFNGKEPLERKKPAFGESKNYFIDPNDSTQTIEVPDGTDPYAFRDAGYKSQSLTDISNSLTTDVNKTPDTDLSGNTSLTNTDNPWAGLRGGTTSSTTTNPRAGLGDDTTTSTTNLWDQESSSGDPYSLYSQKSNPWTDANAYSGLTQGFNNKTSSISPTQDKTYTLQAHSRTLEDSAKTGIGRDFANTVYPYHTGYDLVEKDANGTQNIQTMALYNNPSSESLFGMSKIQTKKSPAKTYQINAGNPITWHDKLTKEQQHYQSILDYLKGKQVQTVSLLEGKEASEAFYKMGVYGDFINAFDIGYDPLGKNCNDWTTLVYNKYIQPNKPQTTSTLFNRNHIGDGGNYTLFNPSPENEKFTIEEVAADTYLENTPIEGYPHPMNIKISKGNGKMGDLATFSNGKDYFNIYCKQRDKLSEKGKERLLAEALLMRPYMVNLDFNQDLYPLDCQIRKNNNVIK